MSNFHVVKGRKNLDKKDSASVMEIVLREAPGGKSPGTSWLSEIPAFATDALLAYAAATQFEPKAGTQITLDASAQTSLAVRLLPKDRSTFSLLGLAGRIVKTATERKRTALVVHFCTTAAPLAEALTDALVSAAVVAEFKPESYKKEKKKPAPPLAIYFVAPAGKEKLLAAAAEKAEAVSRMTNLVRDLAILPANVLTCKAYIERAQKLARAAKLATEFYDYKKLEKMGAGAFIAVAQGSDHRDAGILKISYAGAKKGKRVAVVGKGITFDTGGVNLKPPQYMFGMHGDMAGSAVALALVLLAADQKWDCGVDAYLAVADNAISNRAYRPNEIVRALNGLSIETIDTDAEGRMVLSDTLTLASETGPALVIDFATLTGAAVRALGKSYAAGFANRPELLDVVRAAGVASGERCWPFPTDEDFADALESEIADLKQCKVEPGPDHIWAAAFLQRFVKEGVPYVHIDLSSIEREGGLAHVPTKETGVGVRLGAAIIEAILNPEGR